MSHTWFPVDRNSKQGVTSRRTREGTSLQDARQEEGCMCVCVWGWGGQRKESFLRRADRPVRVMAQNKSFISAIFAPELQQEAPQRAQRTKSKPRRREMAEEVPPLLTSGSFQLCCVCLALCSVRDSYRCVWLIGAEVSTRGCGHPLIIGWKLL